VTKLADVTAALRRADWPQLSLSAEVISQASRGVQSYFYRNLGVRPFHDGPVDMRRPGDPGPGPEELADQYESNGQLLLATAGPASGTAPTGTTRPSRNCWNRPGCSPGSIWR
jgi:hypothetical protein